MNNRASRINAISESRNKIFELLKNPHEDQADQNTVEKFDQLVQKLLQGIKKYNPKTNQHRIKSVDLLLSHIESAYQACLLNLTESNVRQVTEKFKEECRLIKLDVENEHITNGSPVLFKSKLAKILNATLYDEDNNYAEVKKGLNKESEQFNALIQKLMLTCRWSTFLANTIEINNKKPELENVPNFYNKDDEKICQLQVLGNKIVELRRLLESHPEEYHTALWDFNLTLEHVIDAAKTQSFFKSDTAANLQKFIKNDLAPAMSALNNKNKMSNM